MSRQINYGVYPWCKADKTVLKKRRHVVTTLLLVSYRPLVGTSGLHPAQD